VYGLPYGSQFYYDNVGELLDNNAYVHSNDILSYHTENFWYASITPTFFSKYSIRIMNGAIDDAPVSKPRDGCVWRGSKLHYLLERQYIRNNRPQGSDGMYHEVHPIEE